MSFSWATFAGIWGIVLAAALYLYFAVSLMTWVDNWSKGRWAVPAVLLVVVGLPISILSSISW